ncbi:tumor necrosis factor receptor superfamily member 14-like isoform X2 [Montipora capricornis]
MDFGEFLESNERNLQRLQTSKYGISVFLLILNYVNAANSNCNVTQLSVVRGDGTIECEDCPRCPPGQGLSLKCGDLIADPETHITCEHCSPGESYSDKDDILQCNECDSCMEGQEVVHPCNKTTNVQCGKSCVDPNRYFDDERGCLNCSCCGEGNHTVEEECKRKLGAGSNMICSFNSSATGCEFTSPSPQAETTRSHVVTKRLLNQSSSDFITPSPQTETTSSHVVTAGLFNQSISSRDFITPSQQTVTTTNQDATTSKPVTSSINHPKEINDPFLIAVVIVSFLVLFGIVVATFYFLYPNCMQRCWNAATETKENICMIIEINSRRIRWVYQQGLCSTL